MEGSTVPNEPAASGSFGWASEQIEAGFRVQRAAWEHKGDMFLFLVGGSRAVDTGALYDEEPYFALKTPSETTVPWRYPESDIAARDWKVAA